MLSQLLPTVFSLPALGASATETALLVLPIVATAIAIASGVPQLLLLLRTHDAAGVSVAGWGTAAASYAAWIAHSISEGSFGPVLVMGIPAIMTIAVVVLAWCWGGDRRSPAVPFVMLGLMLGAALLGYDAALDVLLASSAVWAYAPNIYAMWTASDLRGNSVGTWVLSSAYGVVWGAYGFLLRDQAILFNGGVNALLAAAVIAGLLAVGRVQPLTTLTTSTSQFAVISTNTAPFDIVGTHTASLGIIGTATASLAIIGTHTQSLGIVSTATAQLATITAISADSSAIRLGGSAA